MPKGFFSQRSRDRDPGEILSLARISIEASSLTIAASLRKISISSPRTKKPSGTQGRYGSGWSNGTVNFDHTGPTETNREKWSTSKRGPALSKLFRLDRADFRKFWMNRWHPVVYNRLPTTTFTPVICSTSMVEVYDSD